MVAQTTISGTIQNTENIPIEFANIAIIDTLSDRLILGTISDKNGYFTLKTEESGAFQLTIQYVGFTLETLPISSNIVNDFKDIILKNLNHKLAEIVVTASRPIIEQEGDKLVFNVGSSPLKSGYDGMETLARAPNVWVNRSGGISLRNGTPTIFINGRPLSLRGEALTTYLQNLQSDNIRSVEIQTNPSASADADNLGGTINIVLKKMPTGWIAGTRVSYEAMGDGFYNAFSAINLNYGAEFWNIYGSYNLRKQDLNANSVTDIIYHPTQNYLKTDINQTYDILRNNAQLGFVISPWKKHAFGTELFRTSVNRANLNDGAISLTNQQDTLDYGVVVSATDLSNQVQSLALNYHWRMDTLNSKLTVIADHTTHDSEDINNIFSAYQLEELTDIRDRNFFDNQTDLFSVQADWVKNWATSLKYEMGAKLANTTRKNSLLVEEFIDGNWIENDRSSQLNYSEQVNAGYVNLSKKIKGKHYFKAGIRVENTDLSRLDLLLLDSIQQNYSDWFPSVFYSYDLPNKATISGSYSRRLNRPSFRDLNNIVRKVNDFRYLIGNPDLRPEYIDQYEITFQKKKQNLSLYYQVYNNAINGVYTLEDGIAYYQRKNAGKQTQYGMEYNSRYKIADWLNLRTRARLYHRKFTTETGEDLFAKTTIDLYFSTSINLDKTTGIDLSGRYLSPSYDAFYQQDPYYWIEFFIKKSFFNKKLNCRIYFNDPLNIVESGNTRPFDNITTSIQRKNRSRSITFWASYNFATKNKVSNKKNKSDGASRRRF
ncbi:MAG: iron complex outermembrane receptor protein [Paraglaciecola sp.]|jgi:iron complex outermembrane receptor protein